MWLLSLFSCRHLLSHSLPANTYIGTKMECRHNWPTLHPGGFLSTNISTLHQRDFVSSSNNVDVWLNNYVYSLNFIYIYIYTIYYIYIYIYSNYIYIYIYIIYIVIVVRLSISFNNVVWSKYLCLAIMYILASQ